MADAGQVRVTVMYSPEPRRVHEWTVALPTGATVLGAVQACGVTAACLGLDAGSALVGVWGRKVRLDLALRDGDRVEIYRPLTVDPKVARRERFRRQGVRAAGLFARK